MEAQSLAALNTLAANPPQYPQKPNEEKREPLVLYISRVPGTRDIILSPFKPQIKNVTAEDVASALYYVHLEMPSSALSGPLPLAADATSRSSEDSPSLPTIPRKPLPDSARPLTPESPPGGTRLQPHPTPLPLHPGHVNHDSEPAQVPQDPLPRLQTGMPARKPLGSRPKATSVLETTPPSLPQDCSPSEESIQVTKRRSSHPAKQHANCLPSPKTRSRGSSVAGTPFTLTLIRRDPSSGNQWNVGRVLSRLPEPPPAAFDCAEASFSALPWPSSNVSANPPIDIEIETSGYAKFRGMPARKGTDGGLDAALSAAATAAAASPSGEAPSRSEIGVFSRQAVMGYSRSWTSTLKEKLHQMEQAGRARINHGRSGSIASVDSAMSWVSAGEGPKMKPQGYVFRSPWDGKCEFRTGHGGRSVQCRHTLHDGETVIYNPLVVDRGSSAPKSGSKTVSDLRFNLPSSELLGEQARNAKDQWRGNFGTLLRPSHEGEVPKDDADGGGAVSPFELNVGSERAGGGNRGGRAKLGKLIVYSDGLKMLDLVVAANVGVWWGAWEKTF